MYSAIKVEPIENSFKGKPKRALNFEEKKASKALRNLKKNKRNQWIGDL